MHSPINAPKQSLDCNKSLPGYVLLMRNCYHCFQ